MRAQGAIFLAEGVARSRSRHSPRPGRIFPLGLREQAIALASGLSRQPIGVGLGVVPAQAGRRMRSILSKSGIAPGTTVSVVELAVLVGPARRSRLVTGLAYKDAELIHRHLEFSD